MRLEDRAARSREKLLYFELRTRCAADARDLCEANAVGNQIS